MTPEYEVITDPYKVQEIRTQRFLTLKWSTEEQLLKDRPKHVKDFFKHRQVPFKLLCETKFKRSLFGIFLHSHNKNEIQDYFMNDSKLAMLDYDLKTYSENELTQLECNNNFTPDLRKLLERAVDEQEVIDYDFLYDNVYALRFCDTPLTFIDDQLLKFHHLKVLILCGNWLTDIPGCCLPKSLEYIELFANQIEFINNFATRGPKGLIHIGLRRNWLTNDSHLHLLGKPNKFHYLQSLDLSENDIYELDELLQTLAELKQLMCLHLQGNPCSVTSSYKDEILGRIPWLVQLDLTEILDKDRIVPDEKKLPIDAGITFTCHRIMNCPKPTKEKSVEKWFYFSVEMPLLEDVIEVKNKNGDIEVVKSVESQVSKKVKEKGADSSKTGKRTSATKTKSGVTSKKGIPSSSPYNRQDEYADECKRHVVDTTFKTARFAWDKIMQLPEEALVIKSAERNFVDIRDTMRSIVCVKLIYLEVRPAEKPKKPNKNKNKSPVKRTSTSTEIIQEPEETIIKKITLAQFDCELHSINWSDQTIDYIWADQEQFENKAQFVEGSLRLINYSENPQKESKRKIENETAPDASSPTTLLQQQVKQPVPKVFTIQVGFGLQRNYYQS